MHSSYFCSRKKYRAEKTTNKKERKKTETLGSTSSEAQPQTNSQKRYHCRHSYYVVGWAAKVLRECSGMGLSITGRCRSKRDQCNSQMLGEWAPLQKIDYLKGLTKSSKTRCASETNRDSLGSQGLVNWGSVESRLAVHARQRRGWVAQSPKCAVTFSISELGNWIPFCRVLI